MTAGWTGLGTTQHDARDHTGLTGIATDAELTDHAADTTSVHGLADTSKVVLSNSATLGFFSVTPVARAAAYTQTYATAGRTHLALVATTVATTGATNVTPYGFTTAAQANDIVAQLNALRADVLSLKGVVNSLIDDSQAYGLAQ